ncbi:MAG: phosphoethanolamine--lipid A transferase [Pararhodobacter sp.]
MRFSLPRPTIGHLTLNIIITGYVMAVLNPGVWARLTLLFPDKPMNVALFALAFSALTLFLLELLGPGALQKPVAAVLILIAATARYFERSMGILVDRELLRSVLETTPTEAGHLVTPQAVGWIALTGLVPALLVFWPRVRRVRVRHQVWRWPLAVLLAFVVFVGSLFADYKAASATLREHRDLAGAYQPGATLIAALNVAQQEVRAVDRPIVPIALDARPGPYLAGVEHPVLMVLFVGETVRAANFGLDGYERDTTPGLAARDVINLPDVRSCGTATAVSVPCMFSPLTQDEYSRDEALASENLLDVLVRAGFDVRWIDNNTGHQHVGERIDWQMVDPAWAPEVCDPECTDDVFLPVIREAERTITRNTVLVLHMIGNHGPAYYLRYRPEDAVFTPDCRTAQFADCAPEEIVNAYDNAVRQTDRVLSATIDILGGSTRVTPAMVFVSDHGESLGEDGLYLHAAPMFMAPDTQTHVPMVMWLGSAFASELALDTGCLQAAATRPASHDTLYSTVLGLLDVETETRDRALDLTAGCRPAAEGLATQAAGRTNASL